MAGVFIMMTVINVVQSSLELSRMKAEEADIRKGITDLDTAIASLNDNNAKVEECLYELKNVVVDLATLYSLSLDNSLSLDSLTAILDNHATSESTLVDDGLSFYKDSYSGYLYHLLNGQIWNNSDVKTALIHSGYLTLTTDPDDENVHVYSKVSTKMDEYQQNFYDYGAFYIDRTNGKNYVESFKQYISSYKTTKVGSLGTYWELALHGLDLPEGTSDHDKQVKVIRWIIDQFGDLVLDGVVITDFASDKSFRMDPPEDIPIDN